MEDARIRILPLSGQWETLGSDRLPGIVPQGIEAQADSWGPSQMSFSVAAEAGARRPDILPFTPVELEVGGLLVWSGFVWQRPSDANSYRVTCRGWQYHLDDDRYDRVYVHTRMGEYRDQRGFLTAQLANFHVGGVVATDDGTITLGWANATVIPAGGSVGVTLDLGPDSIGKRAVIQWESTNNDAGTTFFARATSVENALNAGDASNNYLSFTLGSGASGTTAGTVGTAQRYVQLFINRSAGATAAADIHIRLKSVQIFRDTAYEGLNNSLLKASTVVSDALGFAPVLSQDKSLITSSATSLPSFLTAGYITPREVMEAANLVENFRLKLDGERLMQLRFDAKPSVPIAEVGEWSGSRFEDATITGEPIYNRAILDGTGPDGARLVSKRTQTTDLVSRRGFTRSSRVDVSTPVTSTIADRINDLWLAEHDTAPFSGTLTIVGSGARRLLSGQGIPPYEFLLYSGEKIRLSNRIDPDTGNWGRDGRIAGSTYRHDDRSIEISIDDQRWRFDTILARYAALVGG